jgi:hypothetical protein
MKISTKLVVLIATVIAAIGIASADEITAYLGLQTTWYSFRGPWYSQEYGINGYSLPYELESYDDGIIYWGDKESAVLPCKFTNATITENGDYSVSVSGIDWSKANNDDGFNLIYIDTTIDYDSSNYDYSNGYISHVQVVFDGDIVYELNESEIEIDDVRKGLYTLENTSADFLTYDVYTDYGDGNIFDFSSMPSEIIIYFTVEGINENNDNQNNDNNANESNESTSNDLVDENSGLKYKHIYAYKNPYGDGYSYIFNENYDEDEDEIEGIMITGLEDQSITDLVIPATIDGLPVLSVSNLGDNINIKTVTIPEGVISIDAAFWNCTSLTDVIIPSTVTSISNAFSGCISLTNVTLSEGLKELKWYTFSECTSLTTIDIPDGVTYIGLGVFNGCTNLKSVAIPDSVTGIGWTAFESCTSLKEFKISSNINYIGQAAFLGCSGLTNLTLCNGLTSIGESAFRYCTNLSSVTIPASVTSIDEYAFSKCSNLTKVVFESCATTVADNTFEDSDNLKEIIINHKYSKKVTKPTYLAKGYTTYTCSVCGDTYKNNYTAILTLAKPTVTLANASNGVKVSWSKTTGANGYIVYRKTGSENWTPLKTVTSGTTVSYLDKTAKAGTTYYYTVKAYAGSTKSNKSSFVTNASIKYLKQPTVTLSNASTGVKVTWTKTTGASGYYVYRKTASESWSRLTKITSSSTVSFIDKTAKAGTTYYYTVKAYAGSTTTNKSSYVTDVSIKYLAQPTVTLANASTGVKVTWSKTTGASGYYVYRKTASGSWSRIKTITSVGTISYTDTTAKAGTTYYYTVKAYSGKTYSSYVTDKTIKRLTQPVVTLSNVTKGVKISWKKITGATGYIVYRRTASGSWSRIKIITSASTLSYTDTTGKNGTTYYYTVKAYSGNINSSFVTNKCIKYKK